MTKSGDGTSDYVYPKQFITFKTPSSLPEVINNKKRLINRIRAKQHHGGGEGGEKGGGRGDGDSIKVSTTTEGDTITMAEDNPVKVISRENSPRSPTVLKRQQRN